MRFHLLDVLAHDFVIEAEDETTIKGHYEYNQQDDSEGEVQEEDEPRYSRTGTGASLYAPQLEMLKALGVDLYTTPVYSRRPSPQKSQYVIELFGVNEEGKPVHTKVTGYRPYFYVQLQRAADASIVKAAILQRLGCRDEFRFETVEKRLLFGYTANKTFPMLKISMPSNALFRKTKDIFLNKRLQPIYKMGKQVLDVHEANLDPMLRFFHLQNLEPCGWINVDTPFEYDDINGRFEGECDWTSVTRPTVKPSTNSPFLLASWDIECYSESGAFPLAEKDPIIQIGVVLVRAGKEHERHCFVLGTCNKVEGVVIHPARTERDMLLEWAGFMCSWDPDLLVGYNVFGFDERYVWLRAQKLGIDQNPVFQGFSRLETEQVKLQEKMLSSSAMGDNRLYTWSTPGRLQIDLYHYIKRLEALPSYKLDDVTSHYMSGKLKGISQADGLIYLKTAVTKDVRIGRSIKILDETGEPVADKCSVERIEKDGLVVRSQEPLEDVDLQIATKWAVVKDDVPPQEIFRLHREGGAAGRAKIADYCVQDCNLVVELLNKLDVFNNAMSMANVCSVPVSYIFMRGQGIKIESLIFKECHERNQVVKVLEAPSKNSFSRGPVEDEEEEEEDSYEGAIVFPPKPDFYFDAPVGVCDFASLYPSSIISENISYDTLVWVKEFDLSGTLVKMEPPHEPTVVEPDTRFTDIEFDIWRTDPEDKRKHPEKIKAGLRVCRYAKTGTKKGTLPDILQKLLAARKAKRKQAEKESDPFVKALLDAEQLAYKLTANSLYGQLGSPTFKVRLQNLAASTTAYGRKQITFAKEAIHQFYGAPSGRTDCCAELVYGDTDSLFVNFNPRDEAGERLKGREALVRTIELTEECGKFITAGLAPPHDFEYDKVFWPFIIFSKKRYVGNKYEDSPDQFKQNYMGIVLKRRDNAPIVKTIYGGAINLLLNEKNVPAAAEFVRAKCRELIAGKVSLGQLTITKSLRDQYADPTRIAHKVLADRIGMRDPGNAPASGDRIPYVYIVNPGAQLQGDRIELPSYVREKNLKTDIPYYIEHQLSNPLSQLFSLRVEEIPGFRAPAGGWSDNEDKRAAQREKMAADLLFMDTLQTFSGQRTLFKMGFARTEVPRPMNRVVSVEPVKPAPRQQSLVIGDRWALKITLDNSDKKKKDKKPKKENGTKPK